MAANAHLTLLITLAIVGLMAAGDPFSIDTCDSSGLKCDASCKHIGICIDNVGDGSYAWRQVRDCGDGYCSCSEGSCDCTEKKGQCLPNSQTMTCNKKGTYPDLYNCKRSLYCEPGKDAVPCHVCTGDSMYDPCTGMCDVVATQGCTKVAPLCNDTSKVYQVPTNNRLFYYCAEDAEGNLHPVIDRCDEGFFDPTVEKCVESDHSGCLLHRARSVECDVVSTTSTETTSTTN